MRLAIRSHEPDPYGNWPPTPEQICHLPDEHVVETAEIPFDPLKIIIGKTTVRDIERLTIAKARHKFLTDTKTKESDWDNIDITYHGLTQDDLDRGVIGFSGILRAVKAESEFKRRTYRQLGREVTVCCCHFGDSKVGFMAYAVALEDLKGRGSLYYTLRDGTEIEAPELVMDHELWHTDGVDAATAAILARHGVPTRRGYKHGGQQAIQQVNTCLGFARSNPNTNPASRSDEWCEQALNYCLETRFMNDAVRAWIYENGFWHEADHRRWREQEVGAFPPAAAFVFTPPTP